MSTSDTPRIEGETVFTRHTEAVKWDTVTTEDTFDNLLKLFDGEGDLINLLIRELRATRIELNAARAELAERKPQPSGDEQARFEAWWPTVHQTIGKVAAWAAWQACVIAHQPQGAPVGRIWRDLNDGVHIGWHSSAAMSYHIGVPSNTYSDILLYTADQWPPSPCPHLSTSKEGTSYCKLAEADAETEGGRSPSA